MLSVEFIFCLHITSLETSAHGEDAENFFAGRSVIKWENEASCHWMQSYILIMSRLPVTMPHFPVVWDDFDDNILNTESPFIAFENNAVCCMWTIEESEVPFFLF